MARPKALKLLADAEKQLLKALARAEQAHDVCAEHGLEETSLRTVELVVETLRESRDKLEHGRTLIAQAIATQKLNGGG